ncbi:thiamine-phosphate kinase [Brytella acorum]|uniref:Thiamine-monophosphate kinase n=1 Tax=Brytella acorum TaxID=2959299 RepID=A0AA35Y2D5_9PROT|nr:thiamine-phosphate kinase [Brytella acorum]MDF3624402.1 thiamine-phosphate kinase [Brytella acorum]CAI9119748.1 thiamine-phosphate kinase [Brytella acorum]
MTGAGEFDFIARYFRPLAGREALDLRDDAALIAPRPGHELAISTDTIVENVHFLTDDPPATIAQKLLRVNLSDCAAMGAVPFGYFLNIVRPRRLDDAWFESFSAGLAADQDLFDVRLLGGDTTSTQGPLVLSVTILAWVAQGCALRRDRVQSGDDIWVTGFIGDAALGLRALRGEIPDPDGYLTDRYRVPQPRMGLTLTGIAHAAMDVSDGLIQDCGHLAAESGVGIVVEVGKIPLSPAALILGDEVLGECLTGGDDYELLVACAPACRIQLERESVRSGIKMTRIGHATAENPGGVTVLGRDGAPVGLSSRGWQHF